METQEWQVALEKQLRQGQKFEAIGQLAGGIAHDFNNMIGAILGWAEIGLDETGGETRLHRHFEKIRHQAVRAAALTKQLPAFARRQILEPRNMDMNQNVAETLSLLEKVIGRIDLLLLDVVLPKMNGPEAYARICAEKQDVPVIFATGYSPEMELLRNAQELGLTVLQKPYVPRDLARRVRETLDRQPAKVHPA
jgi:CheY-like chemotaxis protein